VGTLLGLAIGNAMGAPFEGMKDGHIRQLAGEITGYTDSTTFLPDRPGKWRLQGLYTDATQQALALADVLALYGHADIAALAELYVRLAQEGPPDQPLGAHRAVDPFFRRAVLALAEAPDPLSCGQPVPNNGAAARIAPVGLYLAHDEQALARATVESSLLTHHDPRSIAAALAVAWTVARLTQAASRDQRPDSPALALEIAQELPAWVHEWEDVLIQEYSGYLAETHLESIHHFSNTLKPLATLLREGNELMAHNTLLAQANTAAPEHPIAQLHDAFAPASVVTALYRALSARQFADDLLACIQGGGDTGHVGALTGALLGARFGEASIPEAWIAGLLNARQVRLRAQTLRDREVDWNEWEDYVEMEKALTEREIAFLAEGQKTHRKAIEKRQQHQAEHRERAAKAAAKKPPEYLPFAPPPQVWLRGGAPSTPPIVPDPVDPIQARKDRAKRGRKRIAWKDERRRSNKNGDAEPEED
jgi:ADP-ribosyl-[dinitrogen reductase] hydrolase